MAAIQPREDQVNMTVRGIRGVLSTNRPNSPCSTETLLGNPNVFPKMCSLDLSGKDDVKADHLLPFLEAHPRLRFLGLSLTEACTDDAFVDPENRKVN